MGLLIRDDPDYNENVRQTGFYRYKQLLAIRFGQWWKVNLLTLLGCAPLAAGIIYAIGVTSVLVLYPCSILGGIIAGPFLAGLLQLAYLAVMVLFAPWTLLLLPVTGLWYLVFLSQLLLYSRLDGDLQIEEQFRRYDG